MQQPVLTRKHANKTVSFREFQVSSFRIQSLPFKNKHVLPLADITKVSIGLHVLRKAIATLGLAPHRIIIKLPVWFCDN